MSKERALEICKHLEQTISKMGHRGHIIHKNETYEIPRARKSKLIRMRDKLIKKYKFEL